jgi:GAF domain-containing protein
MRDYFRDILASANDQDPGSVRLLRGVLTAATLSIAGIALLLALINREKVGVGFAGAVTLAFLSGLALWCSYRNLHWPGRLLFPLLALGSLTFMAIQIDGLHDSTVVGFTLVIIFASLLTGQRAIPLATFATLLGIWAVAYADLTGINQSMFARNTKFNDALGLAVVISLIQIIAAASLNGLMSRLNFALKTTRASEQGQIKANQELRELQVTLERRVVERTAVAERLRAEAEAARQDLEAQMWVVAGQAALAEKMRGEQSIPLLADNIIVQLGRYLGAQAGALYLLEENLLHLRGSYAFTPRADFHGEFRLGEGWVGQAAVDQRALLVDCPANAAVISTALVELLPRQVLAVPFEEGGRVVGVIELAALTEFTAAQMHFLERVAENIGVAFRTAQARQRLAEVLLETQQQAEELQAQEEELRAANEELQAQTGADGSQPRRRRL